MNSTELAWALRAGAKLDSKPSVQLSNFRVDVVFLGSTAQICQMICYWLFCTLMITPPASAIMPPPCEFIVPDGVGGFVPYNNSRVMPDGSLRPYDPAIDGSPCAEPPPQPSLDDPPTSSWVDPNPTPRNLPDTREWREPQ